MKSYFKFLSRNRLYTAIEAVGLSVSLAFVILTGSYVWQQYSVKRESPDRERIYAFGLPGYLGLTYAFADVLEERLPEVEETARFTNRLETIWQIGENKGMASVSAIEKTFFDIFPYYRFVEGGPEALDSKMNVVVSRSFANIHDISVGESIRLGSDMLTVAAIIEDFKNTLFPYTDLIVSQDNALNSFALSDPYDHYGSAIPFVKVREGTSREELTAKAEEICKEIYPDMYGKLFFEYLDVTRFDEIFFKVFNTNSSQLNRGDSRSLSMLLAVGLLLLLSAVFNYINLNFAMAGRRAKEMAVRRLSGAGRESIFLKYIGESVLFTSVCLAVSILLAAAFAPVLNTLINDPDIPVRIILRPGYIAAFILLALAVGTVSGLLPAMLATRFKPINIVSGSFRRNNKMVFSKIFIVLQNALAVFLIAMALVMEAQYRKSLDRPVNADVEDKYYLLSFTSVDQSSLRDALAALPFVEKIGRASGVPGLITGGQGSLTRDGNEIMYRLFRMDSVSFNMLGFRMIEDYNAPLYNSVWFGESAFKASGFDNEYHDISGTLAKRTRGCDQVAGVISDFPNNRSNIGEEDYIAISVQRPEDMYWSGWLMQVGGDHREASRQILKTYSDWSEEYFGLYYEPQGNFFLTDNYLEGLRPMKNNMRLIELFMILAVIISLSGLVAMSTYYAGEKAKDMALRKVFGGTVVSETRRYVTGYMLMVVAACIVGIPLAVFASREYLKSFIYRLDGYWWLFIVAFIVSLAVSLAAILWQTLSAARRNPAEVLKKE